MVYLSCVWNPHALLTRFSKLEEKLVRGCQEVKKLKGTGATGRTIGFILDLKAEKKCTALKYAKTKSCFFSEDLCTKGLNYLLKKS